MSDKVYFGNYIGNIYEPFINIFNTCNFTSKISLVIIKTIELVTVAFIVVGGFLPRNLLLWHAVACLTLIMFIDINYNPTHHYTLKILKANNGQSKEKQIYTDKEMKLASETVPLHVTTCKKILFMLIIISMIGYLWPQYSLNNIIKKISSRSDNVNVVDMKANDQSIVTEFKIGGKSSNLQTTKKTTDLPKINNELFMDVDSKAIDNIIPNHGMNPVEGPTHAASDIMMYHINDNKNNMFKVDFEPIKFSLKSKVVAK